MRKRPDRHGHLTLLHVTSPEPHTLTGSFLCLSLSISHTVLPTHSRSRTVQSSAAALILELAVSVSWGREYKSAFTIQSGWAGLSPRSLPCRPSVAEAKVDRKETRPLALSLPWGSWPSQKKIITVIITQFGEAPLKGTPHFTSPSTYKHSKQHPHSSLRVKAVHCTLQQIVQTHKKSTWMSGWQMCFSV